MEIVFFISLHIHRQTGWDIYVTQTHWAFRLPRSSDIRRQHSCCQYQVTMRKCQFLIENFNFSPETASFNVAGNGYPSPFYSR